MYLNPVEEVFSIVKEHYKQITSFPRTMLSYIILGMNVHPNFNSNIDTIH